MKIVFVTCRFPPRIGGMETYSFELVKRICTRHNAVVLCPQESRGFKINKAKVVPILPLEIITKDHISAFVKLVRKEKPDILHFLSATFSPLAVLGKYLMGARVITSCHSEDVFAPWGQFPSRYKTKKLLSLGFSASDKIIAVSHFTKQGLVQQGVDPKRIEIIFNGVDHKVFKPQKHRLNIPGVGHHDFVLLTVSRMKAKKGAGTVFEALPSVLKQIPNVKYVVVGGRKDMSRFAEGMQPIFKVLHIEKNVIFTGSVTQKELVRYYNTCDIFIMVSHAERTASGVNTEGFGIVYIEANACAKPVIGSRVGGVSDAIIHGETGLLVNPGNVQQTAKAIIRLLKDAPLRRALGKRGRERMLKELTWDNVVSQVLQIYKDCPTVYNRVQLRNNLDKMGFSEFLA